MAERPNAAVLKTVGRAASRGFESPSLRQMLLQSPSPSEARSPSQPRAGGSNPQGRPRRERAPRALEQRAREGRRPEAGRGRRSRTRNPPLSASRLFLLRNLLRPGAPCSHAQGGSNPQGREAAETRERFPAGARGPQARSGARAAEPAAELPSPTPNHENMQVGVTSGSIFQVPQPPWGVACGPTPRLSSAFGLRISAAGVPPLRRSGNVIAAPTNRIGRWEGRGGPPAGCCRLPVVARPKTATASHPSAEPGKANLSRSDPGTIRPSRRNRSRAVPRQETPT